MNPSVALSRRGGFDLLLYSDATTPGGGETVMGGVVAELPPEVRLSVVAAHPGVGEILAGDRLSAGHPVTIETVRPIRDRHDIAAMRDHLRLLRRLDPDIVQFNLGQMSSCQWAIAVSLLMRRPRIITVEHSPTGTWSPTSRRLKRLSTRFLDARVTVSHAAAAALAAETATPVESVRVIHHGIPGPATTLRGTRRAAGQDAPLRIGTISRHDPVKGLDVLLRAVAQMRSEVRVEIVGDGPERPNLTALRDELGLGDTVKFTTAFGADALWLLTTWDVFVLSSRLEGYPVTTMEAMSAGLAVVASDVGGVREQITDGHDGILVRPDDPAVLAATIDTLAQDPARRASLGAAARVTAAERFGTQPTVAAYTLLYDEVLATSRPRRWRIRHRRNVSSNL